MENIAEVTATEISQLIYSIRDQQVILDRDLAVLYHVATKNLNKAIKRNIDRFPESFCFQLTEAEINNLRFQVGTSSSDHGGNRYLPYAFTESGIAMASAVLRSETAVKASIRIMEAFVAMRKFLFQNANLFARLSQVEMRQLEADQKMEEIFKALETVKTPPDKGIFFDGQVFDAYTFVSDLIRSANRSIILIDNYVDDTVLTLLGKRKDAVSATIYTKNISRQLQLDVQRYNSQYPRIEVEPFANAHDRFLIIDSTELYHIGASIKDLGKKWFAFSKMDKAVGAMLSFLNGI